MVVCNIILNPNSKSKNKKIKNKEKRNEKENQNRLSLLSLILTLRFNDLGFNLCVVLLLYFIIISDMKLREN